MSDDAEQIRGSAFDLVQRLREIVAQREDSLQWFRAWGPVAAAASRLAFTASRISVRLAAYAVERGDGPLLTEDDRAAIASDLEAIVEDFPDIADVLFGLYHIDSLTEAMLRDDAARRGAARLSALLGDMIERVVSRLIDVAMGTADQDLGPERIIAFLGRFEDLAQELLDRWVPHGLGMASSVVAEQDKEEDA